MQATSRKRAEEALRTGKEVRDVIMGISNPGKEGIIWLNVSNLPQFRPGENMPYRIYSIFEDITERYRLEEDLHRKTEELQFHQADLEPQAEELKQSYLVLEESRDRFLDLYEFAPIGDFTLNDKTLIKEVNLIGATLLGVERNKLINHGLGRFIAPESLDAWDQYFVNIRQHGGKHSCTLHLIQADGSLFPAWLEGFKLIDGEGLIAVRITIINITELKFVEDKLRESKERLHSYIDNASDGLFIADETGHYLEVNISNLIILAGNPSIQIIDGTGTLQIFADPLFEKVMYNLIDNTIRHGEIATEVRVSVLTGKGDI